MKKDNLKFNLRIKVVLAIIGIVVIISTGQVNKYGLPNQIDILNIQLPLIVLGILFMLPIIFYIFNRR